LSVTVSASYRTDIPAFCAGWFLRRLRAGHCRVANPYGGMAYELSLVPDAEKQHLLRSLAAIALRRGAGANALQPARAPEARSGEASCIDADRLADVALRPIEAPTGGNRPGCRRTLARDIGAYDTCPHGGVYC
jgi:hypothetical protein